jgi:hypothetical protein
MKQLATIFLLLISTFSFAQPIRQLDLFPVQLQPTNPAPGDDIWLIFRARTANQGYKVNTGFNRAGNDLTFTGCYWGGYATSPSRFVDSVHMGSLPAGRYSVAFIGVESSSPQNCLEWARDTVQLAFEVRGALATKRVGEGWAVYPMPATGGALSLLVPSDKKVSSITLLDAVGRTCYTSPGSTLLQEGGHWRLPLPALPTGAYTLRLGVTDGPAVSQRVLLE